MRDKLFVQKQPNEKGFIEGSYSTLKSSRNFNLEKSVVLQ